MSEGSSDAKLKNVEARRLKKDNASLQEISESDADDSEYDEITDSESTCNLVGTRLDSNESAQDSDGDDSTAEPRTPSRKRKRKEESTPRNVARNKTLAQPTPHSKAALAKRQKPGSSPRKRKIEPSFGISFSSQSLTFKTSMAHLPKDPWLRAMHALHVGSRPDSLPCREEEFNKVMRCISELLEEGSGGCVCKSSFIFPTGKSHSSDISGVPGTGKTATVHTVVKELKRMAENNVFDFFVLQIYVSLH